MFKRLLASALMAFCVNNLYAAELIGEVNTKFNLVGKNDRILVEVFDDPKVQGVSCYISRAKTGGASAMVGLEEDASDASVACRQIGPIRFNSSVSANEEVFKLNTSALFKKLHVTRVVDAKRNVLVYLVYSDKLVDGSPKNSVTAVPVDAGTRIPLDK